MIAISLFYGLVAGMITITAIILSFTLGNDQHAFSSVWLGYLVMIVALSLIFFGTKRYRDKQLGGVITFWLALGLGLLTALVASFVYMLVWELYLAVTGYNFMSNYVAAILEQKTADGLSGSALATETASLAELEKNYQSLAFRLPLTFIEIFPVGLIVALISSALLRNSKFAPAQD